MSYLQLDQVSFAYPGGFSAVENVSMSFEKGEAVAIVGQNGAGKTTTVKLMNGLLRPTSGKILVDDWDTKDYTTAKISRKVGYVFQNPDDQIFHSDVLSEIQFGPKNLKLTEKQVQQNVNKAVELTGLKPYLSEHPYNLPFSIRKFITIAAVIAMDPDVIILDEPTAGQDFPSMLRLGRIISELQKENKVIITITHDMEFVVNNFERVIVMANKQKLLDSSRREVFWDFDILEKAKLKQPYISRVANQLGLGGQILDVNEIIEAIKINRA
ncbi:energy-coupling factor ABC transporter ATP-binding protein [Listeria innocua]|uniref:energy-coupling factor ABC transporter ATP-binding protein n=1 Tax=Listeria innocua TaxID=1642 RepID=UPI0001EBA30F|nr:ABC transporter ATP-binding protein [Listeria innocua]EFR92571.1 cobalt import ATP-binding protein CbiO 2 [Listeria innocua FSL J1-023]OET37630.1 ABC transporter ATP-binding protein [Listeria monocytogenes]UVD65696.1 energy-coupling factor ABC transporter ATP-binding protein [Listeria innocua]HAA0650232.1 ATP-binding cassette domain-containing protein [Listeria innocua]